MDVILDDVIFFAISGRYVTIDEVFSAALFTVTDYNQSTGEVTLEYSAGIITDISYNSSTGLITFTY